MADFEPSAVGYSHCASTYNVDCLELIEALSLKNGDVVLDLGCGTGNFSNLLAQKVAPKGKVLAVDPDSERIKLAQKEFDGTSILEFSVASDKDFPEMQYDVVYCSHVIHWIKDQEATFKRVFQNLKEGGKFGLVTHIEFPIPDVINKLVNCSPEIAEKTIGSWYLKSPQQYEELSALVGFKMASISVKNFSYQYPNFESLVDSLYGIFHGRFDRFSKELDDMRRRYDGQEFTLQFPSLIAVMIKP